MVSRETLKRGAANGLRIVWELGKVVVPLTVVVTVLERVGWLSRIAAIFNPVMEWFGLPGETALAFVLGNISTLYAGVGVLVPLELTGKELTIVSVMLLLCHSLVLETAVVARAGGRPLPVIVARLGAAAVCGVGLNWWM